MYSTKIDKSLKRFLSISGINPADVNRVYAFGIGYNYNIDNNPADCPRTVKHRIKSFYDLKPKYKNFFLEYYNILVIFNNGKSKTIDFYPKDWFIIWEKIKEGDKRW